MSFSTTSKFNAIASGVICGIGLLYLAADGAGLKDAAAKACLNFGTAVGQNPTNVSFSGIIKNEFNMLVCETAMKFDATEGVRGKFTFGPGDAAVNFAAQNSMKMRGEVLMVSSAMPSWVASLTREPLLQAIKDHTNGLMGHWKGKVLEWDVISEAVNDNGTGLRSTFWSRNIGNDFIDSAFVYAHNADPDALLFYNDYNGEGMNAKSDYIYAMVKGMKERGIPIHGVGLECHFSDSINRASITANIKRLGLLGLRVSFTEVDIAKTTTNGVPWKALTEACLENYNCGSFVTWGVHDGISWRGSACGCLIWDAQQQPKPTVYDSILSALNNASTAIAEQRKVFINQKTYIRDPDVTFAQKKVHARFAATGRTVSFFTTTAQNVQVQILDVRGKIATVENLGTLPAGAHTCRLTGQSLPFGLYFVRIGIGGQYMVLPFTWLN